ncbi:MAG: DUF4381 family protein [Gemmatimonadaceae bacterium]
MFAPLALLTLLIVPQGGGSPVVGVDVTPATVAVGQPFTVRVRVRAPAGATIRFPAVPDSAGSVEALDPRAIEDHSTAAVFDQTAVYRFIAWEPGTRVVPLTDLRWEHPRAAEQLAMGTMRVTVTSALPADTTEHVPRAARDPLPPPPQWWRWGLAALALLAIALMSWRAWRRREHARAPADPYVDAERAFAAVDKAAFDDAGEPGRAVLAYAEVMREYLTRRFPRATDGLVTDEFVQALEDNALPILPQEVRDVLAAADAVKFAAAVVDAAGVRAVATGARGVVRDVQTAYEARLAAADKGPRGRRKKA